MFKTLKHKLIYRSSWQSFYEDAIEFPNSQQGQYAFLERKNGAVAVVSDEKNNILLIKQYRYPIKANEWGIPGGGIDQNESAQQAVRREIKEETALEILSCEKLGSFFPLSSCSTEKVTLFWARVREFATLKSNQYDEVVVEYRVLSLKEAVKMVQRNEITEALTCMAILLVNEKLKNV